MERENLTGHLVGISLVLAMLTGVAAFGMPQASGPQAYAEDAAASTPDVMEPQAPAFNPSIALSP